MPLAVFVADASPEIGAGHVMRCLALADTLGGLGWNCAFVTGPATCATVPALANSGHQLKIVSLPLSEWPAWLAKAFDAVPEWLIVDHYGIDAPFELACRIAARNILVIDDLANRLHDCDVLLDQGPGRRDSDYANLVPRQAQILTGPGYALLRPAFGAYRDQTPIPAIDSRGAICVGFGASDVANATMLALAAVAKSGFGGVVDVIVGASAPLRDEVVRQTASLDLATRVHIDVANPIPILVASRLAVGAGGVSALERCCFGVPSLVTVAAENQRLTAAGLAAAGAADNIDHKDIEGTARCVADMLADPNRLKKMSIAGQVLCDGRGTRRVAMLLAPETSNDGTVVRLRPATLDDEMSILKWQQFPETRRFARNPAPPDAAGHAAWLRETLSDPERLLNIIDCGGQDAGVVRLDRRSAIGSLPAFEISILVAPGHYRLGIGRAALALARRLVPKAVFLAAIHPDNAASRSLFKSAGYIADGDGYTSWPDHTSQQGLPLAWEERHA